MSARELLRSILPESAYFGLGTLRRAPASIRERRTAIGHQRHRILQAVTAAGGWEVQSGPFHGMRFLKKSSWAGDVAAKLLGSYESELHAEIEELVRHPYRRVVNIGCAEGYYAVGLARRLPEAEVFAVDIDPRGLYLCARLAGMNGVRERLHLVSTDDASYLEETTATSPALVVVDCEGCEVALLDPTGTPSLVRADLIVELHDFVDPTISTMIVDRFRPTHDVTIVDTAPRDPGSYPILHGLDPADQAEALDEHRPGPMQWAILRARAGPAAG